MITKEKAKELGKEPANHALSYDDYTGKMDAVYSGITKREYFAGLAMQGMAGNSKYTYIDVIASNAVRIADALLEELCREE